MANPKKIVTSGIIFEDKGNLSRGVIEVVSLSSSAQNSFADVYQGNYANGIISGTHLWHIACPANSYNDTNILNIPYEGGVYGVIAGTGASLGITIR